MSQRNSLFSLGDVKTRNSRNGFDLSFRNLYTAAPGQLLPIMCYEGLPGDKFKLGVNSFSRTQTLNTAAFARFKEYFDFICVPTRLLWSDFDDFVMQLPESDRTRLSGSGDSIVHGSPDKMPYADLSLISAKISAYKDSVLSEDKDELGFNKWVTAQKLLDLLGYGANLGNNGVTELKVKVNPFPMLGYQKIYQDFYRSHEWENFDASTFNIDFMTHSDDYHDDIIRNSEIYGYDISNYFRLRYCNFKKDYFFGMRPTTQYGDVSVVQAFGDTVLPARSLDSSSPGVPLNVTRSGQFGSDADHLKMFVSGSSGAIPVQFQSQYDILALRKAEALQRWKEVTMAHDFRYKAQVRAHFGFDVPDSRASMSEYIGGVSNTIKIQDVDATSSGPNNMFGQVGGKGLGVSDAPKVFDYECKEHCYIYCIYHIEPQIDFPALGIKRQNLAVDYEDFFIPEYQNIGLDSVRACELTYWFNDDQPFVFTDVLGYAPRYLRYKTAYDEIHGEFISDDVQGSLSAWSVQAIPSTEYLWQSESELHIDYRFFKIRPDVANSIFAYAYNGNQNTDPFMISANLNVFAVRGMSIDGMPY